MPKAVKSAEQKAYEAREREWRKQADARTVLEAQAIMSDKKRLKEAEKYIKEEKDKAEKTVEASKAVLRKTK